MDRSAAGAAGADLALDAAFRAVLVSVHAIAMHPSRRAHPAFLFVAFVLYSALSLGQEVERPSWSPSDTWTYQRWELPATWDGGGRLPGHRKFTVMGGGPTDYRVAVLTWQDYAERQTTSVPWRMSRNLNTYYREDATVPWTEMEFLRWPLVVGKSWNFTHPMPDGSKFEWHVTVAGMEEVSVPAGTFKAVVVKVEGATGAHYTQSRTLWYSPDARAVVKHEWRGYYRMYKDYGELAELESFSRR